MTHLRSTFTTMLACPATISTRGLASVRSTLSTGIRHRSFQAALPVLLTRSFTTTKMSSFSTPSSDPPKKEMVYFPDMTTALPSKSAEFRRILWTGLYSQLVLMTIPVGGDIGEEVCSCSYLSPICVIQRKWLANVGFRSIPLTRP